MLDLKKYRKITGIAIGVLYLASLAIECYLVDDHISIGSFGLVALILGWLNFDFIGVVWLANPLFLISFLLFFGLKKLNISLILSLIASILTICFMQIDEIYTNEAGHKGMITGYRIGYWFWVSANVLMFLNLVLYKLLSSRNTPIASK